MSPDERKNICNKMHLADAKMSLASALLKRAFIAKTLGVPWRDIRFARKGDPVHGKPCYVGADGRPVAQVDFNVSHQAGLVALVGSTRAGVELGVDITCVNERNDYRLIDREGLGRWLDVYDEVFSPDELWDLKYSVDAVTDLDGTRISAAELGRHDRCCSRDGEVRVALRSGQQRSLRRELIVEAKLRRFYSFYAYKEAYIKLVGEGLLAKWLKQLEFRNVRSPGPGTAYRCSTHGAWGEKVDDVEVWMHGKRVYDVAMTIQAFEEDRLIATAIRSAGESAPGTLPPFESADLQRDLLVYATE